MKHSVLKITNRNNETVDVISANYLEMKRSHVDCMVAIAGVFDEKHEADKFAYDLRIAEVINPRRIQCVETGQVFETSAAAARFVNVSTATISQHLNKPLTFPTAGGRVFKRMV